MLNLGTLLLILVKKIRLEYGNLRSHYKLIQNLWSMYRLLNDIHSLTQGQPLIRLMNSGTKEDLGQFVINILPILFYPVCTVMAMQNTPTYKLYFINKPVCSFIR